MPPGSRNNLFIQKYRQVFLFWCQSWKSKDIPLLIDQASGSILELRYELWKFPKHRLRNWMRRFPNQCLGISKTADSVCEIQKSTVLFSHKFNSTIYLIAVVFLAVLNGWEKTAMLVKPKLRLWHFTLAFIIPIYSAILPRHSSTSHSFCNSCCFQIRDRALLSPIVGKWCYD